jgi:amidase
MNAPHPRIRDTVFIETLERREGVRIAPGALRIGIKDLINVAGSPTTAGSRAVQALAVPAERDAALMAPIREAEAAGRAVIVGKTNLHELAYGG